MFELLSLSLLIHDLLHDVYDTFKKLNSSDKKHFCDVLKRACENFEHKSSKDIMQFHKDLKVMCQVFDKVEQMHQNHAQIKTKQVNADTSIKTKQGNARIF